MDYEERVFIAENQLTTANKAIVALSERIDDMLNSNDAQAWKEAQKALTTHAETIKRAKEST